MPNYLPTFADLTLFDLEVEGGSVGSALTKALGMQMKGMARVIGAVSRRR